MSWKASRTWWKRNTQIECPRLRSTVMGHERFFSAACHIGFDARFGVQDLALLGEPPVEAPPRSHLRRGFHWWGSLMESRNFVRPCKLLAQVRRVDMHLRPIPISRSLRSTASGSPIRRSRQCATGCCSGCMPRCINGAPRYIERVPIDGRKLRRALVRYGYQRT